MKRSELLELKRALSFLVNQIKRGYSPLEALEQVENGYGAKIRVQCGQSLRNYFRKAEYV